MPGNLIAAADEIHMAWCSLLIAFPCMKFVVPFPQMDGYLEPYDYMFKKKTWKGIYRGSRKQ